jgi:hypothetical protein
LARPNECACHLELRFFLGSRAFLILFADPADSIGGSQIEKMLFFYLTYRKLAFRNATPKKKIHQEFRKAAFGQFEMRVNQP